MTEKYFLGESGRRKTSKTENKLLGAKQKKKKRRPESGNLLAKLIIWYRSPALFVKTKHPNSDDFNIKPWLCHV